MAIGGREGPDREGEYRIFERPRILAFTWLPDRQADATETLVRRDPEEKDRGFTGEDFRAGYRGGPQVLAGLRTYVEMHT
jgi:hypothetical protein